MKASVLFEQGKPLSVEELELEPPRTGEVLALLGPCSIWFALGFRRLDAALAGQPALRAALHGWLAAFAGVLYLGFAG